MLLAALIWATVLGATPGAAAQTELDTDGDGVADSADRDDDNDGIIDAWEGIGDGSCRDTDDDDICDFVDLDSDNDGISDLIEAGLSWGAFDADLDGVIDPAGFVDEDGDGIDDALEATYGANRGVDPIDSDDDGDDDVVDLDSDDDWIPDAIEALPTAGYQAAWRNDGNVRNDDGDGDGVWAAHDGRSGHGATFVDPVRTDGDATPDFRDTDSDDDGLDDRTESGLSGPAASSYRDPDGSIAEPSDDMANETGDTSEVAYREVTPVDSDGDSVFDRDDTDPADPCVDPNDDGWVALDTNDCDGDGITVADGDPDDFVVAQPPAPATYPEGDPGRGDVGGADNGNRPEANDTEPEAEPAPAATPEPEPTPEPAPAPEPASDAAAESTVDQPDGAPVDPESAAAIPAGPADTGEDAPSNDADAADGEPADAAISPGGFEVFTEPEENADGFAGTPATPAAGDQAVAGASSLRVVGELLFDLDADGELADGSEHLDGAVVELWGAGADQRWRTDDDVLVSSGVHDGGYELPADTTGIFEVRVVVSSLPSGVVLPELDSSRQLIGSALIENGEVELRPFAYQPYSVCGQVTSEGEQLADAKVQVTDSLGNVVETRSDATGGYCAVGSLETPLESGLAVVSASKVGVSVLAEVLIDDTDIEAPDLALDGLPFDAAPASLAFEERSYVSDFAVVGATVALVGLLALLVMRMVGHVPIENDPSDLVES